MARFIILSVIAAAVYAARVDTNNAGHASQAVADTSAFAPQPRASPGMPRAPSVVQSVQVGIAPQTMAWRHQVLLHSGSPGVSMQDQSYRPDLHKLIDAFETDVNTSGPTSTALMSAMSTGLLPVLRQQGRPAAGSTCAGTLKFHRRAPQAALAMQAGKNEWNKATWGDGPGQNFEVEFTIQPDGRMSYKIKGIKGDGCVPVSDKLKEILEKEMGCEVYEETATEEMFEQPVNVEGNQYETQELQDNNGSTPLW